ncbi:MAG: hypothetical protein ABI685_13080 [Ferruginibacter sp.]
MKCSLLIKCFLLFICIESCNARNGGPGADTEFTDTSIVSKNITTDSFPAGKLIPGIICGADARQSYALYIPAKNERTSLPVIYFFDPHGDGAGALQRYIDLAERYRFIMVASNNSKNGNDWPTEDKIWNSLYTDIQTRLKPNNSRIYVCGFSGGAKAATYFTLQHNYISGVIACGGALPEITQSGNFNFSFTAITGEGDMNRSDLVAVNSSLNDTSIRHRIIFFDGIHAWPPAGIMDMAFAGLQLDAMAKKIIPIDSAFINAYIGQSQKSVADLSNANKPERAEAVCTFSINLLKGLSDAVNWFAEKDKMIKSSKAYQQQLAISTKLQQREQEIKMLYQSQFQQGDMNYWVATINDIMARIKGNGAEAAMYQRLKAYLSLAFYSISNQNINNGQDAAARHFVILYTLVDSSNSEAWYFSAILNARNKNAGLAKADLLKAISNGFNDKERLRQQPEFQGIDLTEITGKMK